MGTVFKELLLQIRYPEKKTKTQEKMLISSPTRERKGKHEMLCIPMSIMKETVLHVGMNATHFFHRTN